MSFGAVPTPLVIDGPPDPVLVRIRELIYQAAGIFHPDAKLSLLGERCARRMKDLGFASLHQYAEYLMSTPARQVEMLALLNEITIGETCFFRSQPQLDAFRQVVLRKVIDAKRKIPATPLRIWSAGCSTGEEPYTLSIILQEESTEILKGWPFEILATDLNYRSLDKARAGLYDGYSTRYLPEYYKQKYFTQVGDQLEAQSSVRNCITFNRINLSDIGSLMPMHDFDVIFCCNVLIYFDLASKRRVVEQFYRSLSPHGYLFLGRAESLFGVNNDFHLVHLPGATAYIRGDRANRTCTHDHHQ